MHRGGFLLSQYNVKNTFMKPEFMKTQDATESRKRSVFMQKNSKLLEEIKINQKQRKFEYLDQMSVQQAMNIKFDRDTWEKFHTVKSQVEQNKSQITGFVNDNKDSHLIIYLGSSGQMVQVSKDLAIYAGGLGVNYKKNIVKFSSKGSFEENLLDCSLLVEPYRNAQKQEILMPGGRVGHQAVYSEAKNSVYIFAG